MRFRKLRIAWSVGWGLACVLLIVLWVRSYQQLDEVRIPFPGSSLVVVQSFGGGSCIYTKTESQPSSRWGVRSKSVDELSRLTGFEIIPPPATFRMKSGILWVPYWFEVPVLALLAASPSLTWRFSLRTLLIATTLVALVLGLIIAVLRWPAG
jgi:hypothetical protein